MDAAGGVNGTGPSARYFHAMSAVGTDLYLFGGRTLGEGGIIDGGQARVAGGGHWCVLILGDCVLRWDCDCLVRGLKGVCEYDLIIVST
jgi:hypothetical protein